MALIIINSQQPMMNMWQMAARIWFLPLLIVILSGCLAKTENPVKIALLAPFEGSYREVGYEALYAAQLAMADSGTPYFELLALDDGGSIESAKGRARAILHDPAIRATLVLGNQASADAVQNAFGNHPVMIVGHWNAHPVGENTLILTSREIDPLLTQSTEEIGSEMLILQDILPGSSFQIVSSANLPDALFRKRYVESNPFAPEPGLFATLTYDATALAIQSVINNTPMKDIHYAGINGSISFEDGYWKEAPINTFIYEKDKLTASTIR